MPRCKNVPQTPPIGVPKIHWDNDITEMFNFIGDYDYISCRKSPFYKYVPDVQDSNKIFDLNLGEKIKHLDVRKDENGNPLILYHCTDAVFEKFNPLSFFGTKAAASQVGFELACCKNMGMQSLFQNADYEKVTGKKLLNKGAWRQLQNLQKLRLIPVCLHLKNPLVVSDTVVHNFEAYQKLILNFLEREAYTPLMKSSHPILNKFGIAKVLLDYEFNKIPPEYDMIFDSPFKMSQQQIAQELQLEKLFKMKAPLRKEHCPAVQDMVWENKQNLSMQRMIRFLEKRGYDGFAFRNWTDDAGSITYIAFRPEQVIRLDRKLPPRLFKNRPALAHEKRLNVLEAKARAACCMREATEKEKSGFQYFQERILKDIPVREVQKSKLLSDIMNRLHPNWRNSRC